MRETQRLATSIVLCGAVLTAALSGCAVSRTWEYPPDPPGKLLDLKAAQPISAKVAVRPLRDLRGEAAQQQGWRVAIPFYPYAADSYDRPETALATEGVPLIRMNPSVDFARAAADEIRNTGAFSSVSFAEEGGIDGADFVLSGSVRSTGWRQSFTTYMLGPAGTIFWILGAPIGNTTNTVEMDLQLARVSDPQRAFWHFTMQFKDEHLIGAYYGMEESVKNYSTAIQETLKPALADLIKMITERPEVLQNAR